MADRNEIAALAKYLVAGQAIANALVDSIVKLDESLTTLDSMRCALVAPTDEAESDDAFNTIVRGFWDLGLAITKTMLSVTEAMAAAEYDVPTAERDTPEHLSDVAREALQKHWELNGVAGYIPL